MKKSAYLKTMFQKYGNEITVYPKYKKEYQVKGFIRPLSFQHLPSSGPSSPPRVVFASYATTTRYDERV